MCARSGGTKKRFPIRSLPQIGDLSTVLFRPSFYCLSTGAPGPPSSGSFRQDDGRRDCCRKGERGRQMLQTASRNDDEAIRSLSSFWLEQAPQESEVRQLNGETAQ